VSVFYLPASTEVSWDGAVSC